MARLDIDIAKHYGIMIGDPQSAEPIRPHLSAFSSSIQKPQWGRAFSIADTNFPSVVLDNAVLHLSPQISALQAIGEHGLRNHENALSLFDSLLSAVGEKVMEEERREPFRPKSIKQMQDTKTFHEVADYLIARVAHPVDYEQQVEEVQAAIEARITRVIANLLAPDQIHNQLQATGLPVSFDYQNSALITATGEYVLDELLRLSKGVKDPKMDVLYANSGLSFLTPIDLQGDPDRYLYTMAVNQFSPTELQKAFAGLYIARTMMVIPVLLTRVKDANLPAEIQEVTSALSDVCHMASSLVTIVGFPIQNSSLQPTSYNRDRIPLFPNATFLGWLAREIERECGQNNIVDVLGNLKASDIDFAYLSENAGAITGLTVNASRPRRTTWW